MGNQIYRRNATYWWRSVLQRHGTRVDVRVSLRTSSPTVAKTRGAYLVLCQDRINMFAGYNDSRDRVITAADLQRAATQAFQELLARFIYLQEQQAPTVSSGDMRLINQAWADLYQWLASGGDLDRGLTPAEDTALKALGYDSLRLHNLVQAIEASQDRLPICLNTIDAHLDVLGLSKTEHNRKQVLRALFPAYRDAVIEAENERQRRLGIPPSMIKPIGYAARNYGSATPQMNSPHPEPANAAAGAPPQYAEHAAAGTGGRKPMTVEEALEALIERQNSSDSAKEWRSAPQARTAIKLLLHVVGENRPIASVSQRDIRRVVDLMSKLPSRWGRTAEEQAGGIVASLQRAKDLDPADTGIAGPTVRKHLTYIKAVFDEARTSGEPIEKDQIDFAALRRLAPKSSVRRRDRRMNWTEEEVAHLLTAPPFHGCRSIADRDRFVAGDTVIHDVWYWGPLILIHNGGRSAEPWGMRLDEVYEDAALPYLKIKDNELRRLKNKQSERKLPIHPELIRLGFLDYVKELKRAGEIYLFPEMIGSGKLDLAKVFYKKVFAPWRTWGYPEGTGTYERLRGAQREKDVHSFRGLVTDLMKGKVQDSVVADLLGHEAVGTTNRIYSHEASLSLKLDAMELTTKLTTQLRKHDLDIRPAELRRFGATSQRAKRPA